MRQETKLRSSWVILLCTWLMGFALESPMFCVPPIMHTITEELLLSHAQAGLIFSVPLIILAAVAMPGGVLADRIGVRKAAGIGIIFVVVGSLLRGTSTSFTTLLAFTCLYGVGLGLVFPNFLKLASAWFPPEKIGLATGVYTTGIVSGIALSLAITLPVVLPITNTFQGVFYIWTIPAIAAAIVWWIVVKETPRNSAQNKQIDEVNRPSYQIWTNRTLWLIAILFFLGNFLVFTWTGWTPQLMIAKGASPTLAALMTSFIPWLSIPFTFAAPWASDKIGSRKLFLWPSFILYFLASLGAIYAPLPLGWAIVAAVGIAAGVAFPIVFVLLPDLVPTEGIGRASGMVLSIGFIGGLVGPWVAGYILDNTGNLNLNLIVLASLAAIGTYLTLRLPETGTRARLQK
jgi:cyanate permease